MSFGNTTIAGATELQNSSMVTPRMVVATDYTPAATEYITNIRAYVRNPSASSALMRVGIYNVTGGDATATLIAQWQLPIPVTTAAWVSLDVSPQALTAGQTYNFAFCDDASTTVSYFLYRQTTTNKAINIGVANRLLPNPAGASQGNSTVDPLIEIVTSTGQEITSINGGSPITAGQTGITSVSTGFTGLPSTITTNASGVTCSSIGGTTNAATFNISDRVDAGLYPKSGTSVTFTFTNGAESDSFATTIVKKATETLVAISSPLFTANTLAQAILDQTGRTVATGDEFYHTTYSDLVITADTDFTVTDAGSFDLWLYVSSGADSGKNYNYTVTITEDGGVVITSSSKNHYIGLGLGIGF